MLPATVLSALGNPAAAAGGSALQTLLAALAPQALTLVLDNAEPVADEVAQLAQAVLEAAPGVRLLVTSQIPLRLQSEQVYRLGALEVPEGRVTPAQAALHGAVALFVERARAADPNFALDTGNVGTVVEICRRLDGLALALELAAARVPALGLTALAAALDERLRVLGSGSRAAPARQRTLRAALEWSCGLLDARAQHLFQRLGVFAGGFDLASAQQVVVDASIDTWAVIDALAALVDGSLVAVDTSDPPRYGLLESARLFALEQLERAGELHAVRARHLAWCAALVGRARDATAITADYPNVRAALEWALADPAGDRTAGAALANALVPYWTQLDENDERERWLGLASAPADAAPAPPQPDADAAVTRLVERLQAGGATGDAKRAGIDPETVIALARRLRPDEHNFDAAVKELERAVDLASKVLAEGGDGELATDAFVSDVLAAVAEQTRSGDFDRGADAVDDALAELERREARLRAAMQRSRRALLEAGVQQDLLRRDAFAVARRVETIGALDDAVRPAWGGEFREREERFLEEGMDQGITLSLAVAIEMARRRLAAARDASERRNARRVLGHALAAQAERESAGAPLMDAVQALRDALAETERDESPLEWAELFHELAAPLRLLGMREASTTSLEESAQCCLEALKERTRDRVPLDWAATQHELGATLRSLGARETGTVRLAAAARALKDAMLERSRKRAPLDWARTQVALGITLSIWARRDGNLARRHEAVAAYRDALKEVTRERFPLEWANIHTNLGIELSTIGELENNLESLQASVAAYRAALLEHAQDRAPLHWARTRHNMGGALRLVGEREDTTENLHQAVAAFRDALREHTRERLPFHWAAGKNDLALALLAIGRRERTSEPLEEAVRALRDALTERRRDVVPIDWATTSTELGQALFELAQVADDRDSAQQALQTCTEALDVLTVDATPRMHVEAEECRKRIRQWLAGKSPARHAAS